MQYFKKLFVIMMMLFSVIVPSTALAADATTNSSSAVQTEQTTDDSLQRIKEKGTLVIGTSPDFPPYEFTNKKGGKSDQVVGFEISLAKKLAKDLGVKLVIKKMDFDSILVALETRKIDVGVSGFSATPERKKSVDFSDTYLKTDNWMLINKAEKDKFKTIKDFKGKTVGTETGTIQTNLVKEQMPYAKSKALAKYSTLVIGLQSHKVDGVLMDNATAKAFAANNSNLYAFKADLKVADYGCAMAFHKGDTSLVQAANKTIAQVKKEDLINKKWIPEASQYMESYKKENTFLSYWTFFAKGIEYTLLISVLATFIGIIVGTLFAMMRLSDNKLLHTIAVCYIEFLRGTPMLVQILFVYFGIGAIIQSMPAVVAGVIAVGLNSGAYVAETIRSGIQSLPIGQTEAARSLGLSKQQAFRFIIFPQALKNIWPALGNEMITLLKDSSLVSTIGVADLMYQTQQVQSLTYKGVLPLFVTMIIYFVLTFTLSQILLHFERKMNHAH